MNETIKKMIRSEFDKGIEIPNISLENINKALKELHGTTNEMLNPFDSVFDKIAKDIRDRQDNVIAMEFTKCIGELLRKNGVVSKMTEYTRNFETDKTFETRYGVSIDELDFSEHDKVFEDKIAKLEKEVAEWKAEAREIKKNRDEQLKSFRKAVEPYVDILHMHETIAELKQRIAELENFSCQAEQETESLVEKLKQRIAELESKETETCENEPKISDSAPSREWYENRHQSDCIEINRLNTTIDVLIHKVEYLRQFAGLE